MAFAPLTFQGISSYSADFQTVLDRAVRIASLPLKALQNENADLLSRKAQLGTINGAVSGLTAALSALGRSSAQKGLVASSSQPSVVSVSNANASSAATYTINSITSLAAAASETSTSGYATSDSTAVSASGTLRLTVGDRDFTINLGASNNNLAGLRNAINALGAGVNASIITTGTGANPNFLSVTASTPGATTLRLVEDPNGAATNLLTTTNQGANAVFQLNGLPVSRTSNQVNDVVPGLSFNLLGTSSTPVTLSLATQKSRLTDSLAQFVNAFNSVTEAVSAQVGPNAGLLSGDYLVREIQKAQREISNYAGPMSLAELGVTFDATGRAALDSSKVASFTDAQLARAFEFLGTEATGFGGLSKRLEQISDPLTGLVKIQQDSYDRSDQRLKTQISDLEERINNMKRVMQQRLQAMDSLLGALDGQQKIINASIQAVNLSLFGKKE